MALVDAYPFLIFDFGGVLVTHQTVADQEKIADLLGIPSDVLEGLYWRRRTEHDRGTLSAVEYWSDIAEQGRGSVNEAKIEALETLDAESWMHFDEVMWQWIGELRKAGKRLALLSNMPRGLGEALKTRTRRFAEFDAVTLSYEVDSVKPEPAIYECCLAELGAPAEQTLFFDDKIENIRGAERLGIRGEQFLDRDGLLRKVRGE